MGVGREAGGEGAGSGGAGAKKTGGAHKNLVAGGGIG